VFEGFEEFGVETSVTTIRGRRGGEGPPLLLLHGIPETHVMWRLVAPRLAEHFTVVATDLRGFGASGKPPGGPAAYSMRELARDQVEVMRALGHDRFAVAGHDRGARCAYRMALDHPDAVSRLAVLDIVPTEEVFRRMDGDTSLGFWVWSFLAAPEPVPERLIAQAPDVLVNHMLDEWSGDPAVFGPEIRAEYVAAFGDPETIHAICEQYRAAATLDREHDREGGRIECPVLVLWSEGSPLPDPLETWRGWATDVRGGPLRVGHFLPEEAPDETAGRLIEFLTMR
jgi:haloacetate dehalogenase